MENKNLLKALIGARKEFGVLEKDGKGQFNNRYATIDTILSSIMGPLNKHDLMITQTVEENDLVTSLWHISGESMGNRVPLIHEKPTIHGMASAITYARRYGICALLGLTSDEDEDGHHANKESMVQKGKIIPFSIKEEDIKYFRWLLHAINMKEEVFFQKCKLDNGWMSFSSRDQMLKAQNWLASQTPQKEQK